MTGRPRVVIAGGGTGGHLFPGLAVADALAARGFAVTFIGTAAGIEARLVPGAGYELRLVPGRQLRGGGVVRGVVGLAAALRGALASLGLLREIGPRLVVGVGGYASVAVALAARVRGIPTVLLEQNAVPGGANRLLGRIAARVCVGFEETVALFPAGRAVCTGNPVRADVLRPRVRPSGRGLGLLVLGGSQGAHRLNQAMLEALPGLGPAAHELAITHQTGTADRDAVAAGYTARGLAARVEAFVSDMGGAYAAADLVVSRAGAMSCAEITAVGLPCILVPYPHAADDHQRRNAEVLVRAGAARLVLDRDLTGPRLAAEIGALVAGHGERATMAAAARALGRRDAAERVVAECLRLAEDARVASGA